MTPELEALMEFSPRLERQLDLGPFVYFIRHGEYVKIGTSIDPEQRLEQLSRPTSHTLSPELASGYPELIGCIPGSVLHERQWHQKYADLRHRGEWFSIDDHLVEGISEAIGQQISIELQLSGAEPDSQVAGAIALRKLPLLDRLEDPDYALMHDEPFIEEAI